MHQPDLALLLLRGVFGVFLAYHGYNKVFGGNGLQGTAGWFGSIGMKWPLWQARAAAATEIGAGLLFAAGLLTPFAAAGIVAVMVVAIPVAGEKDQIRMQVFEENYRIIIEDRRRYTASLRAGDLVPYTETVVGGGPVSNVVTDFTAGVKGNDVPECSPPGELGGDIKV